MRKWTVRCDNEVGDAFADFCEFNNLTVTGLFCAMANKIRQLAEEPAHVGKPLTAWDDWLHPDQGYAWELMLADARRIDRTRRQRTPNLNDSNDEVLPSETENNGFARQS